ncbi:MAG: universal stress protein [Phaeodactylibacter sp.]|nr:universal stress protein [Phaeodactylibacter sp.]MCB9277161.1 universal stress protein [Lewinellaceae bacterium]
MKNLLVPTDFSEASRNAFLYAVKLAELLRPEAIEVVHVYLPETSGEADFIPPVVELMESRQEMLRQFVSELAEESAPLPCPVKHEVLVGFPADELTQVSAHYSFIVMGAKEERGILEKVLGSVSSSVSQRAHCPVFLIPRGAAYKPYRNIIYASNFDSANKAVLEKLVRFNQNFNAHLHFVHIRQEQDSPLDGALESIFGELFEDGEPGFAFDVVELDADSVADGLNNYAEKIGSGLIVMATRHRSFWQSILHRSETKRMAFAANTPLMVLHLKG